MRFQKYSLYRGTLSAAFCVALVSFSLVTPQLQRPSLAVKFPPTQRVGAPRSTGGGGTRGGPRSGLVQQLTVVAPNNNLWTTVSATPTLFWYIPSNNGECANFTIFDSNDEEVYQTTLALKGTPGVVKLSIPAAVSLKTGNTYRWTLSLECNSDEWNPDQTVEGAIKRTELSRAQKAQLAAARQPLQKAQVYANAGVWQETVTILAQLRQTRPYDRNIRNAWRELLGSVGLQAIANEPLVNCCRTDK